MPEGDTIRRLAARINDRFEGDRVERSEFRDPRLAGLDLVGRVLLDADAYGKHLFVRFDDGRSLHAHLLMTGSFAVGPESSEPVWKRRVELWLERGRLTAESVPVLAIVPTGEEPKLVEHLGPDLCSPSGAPDPVVVAERMATTPEAPFAGAMLEQRHVAGFGNVYANEVPFIAGVSPFQPIGSITGLDAAIGVGVALIRTNADRGPQNTTGRRLPTDARWVHGGGRRPCPVCGTRLEYRAGRETPWERSITWCAGCQPLAEARTVDLDRVHRLIALHPATKRAEFPAR